MKDPLKESSDEEVFDDGDKDDRMPIISEIDRLAFITYCASMVIFFIDTCTLRSDFLRVPCKICPD